MKKKGRLDKRRKRIKEWEKKRIKTGKKIAFVKM